LSFLLVKTVVFIISHGLRNTNWKRLILISRLAPLRFFRLKQLFAARITHIPNDNILKGSIQISPTANVYIIGHGQWKFVISSLNPLSSLGTPQKVCNFHQRRIRVTDDAPRRWCASCREYRW
jgi:hypothetical protein